MDKTSKDTGWRCHLKSGMPLGVLIPAPAITTTRRHSFFLSSSATSFKVSFCFPSSPPPHLPKMPLAAALRQKSLELWILLGTEGSTALRENRQPLRFRGGKKPPEIPQEAPVC